MNEKKLYYTKINNSSSINKHEKTNIRLSVYILALYLSILPIDATLGNIFGSISIINYILMLYVGLRILSIIVMKKGIKVNSLLKCNVYYIYFLYFLLTILWSINSSVSSWHLSSIIGCYTLFICAATYNYTLKEYEFLKKSVIFSGILVVLTIIFNPSSFSDGRLILNLGRYMDPNFFAAGLVLVSAVLIDNIIKNKYKIISAIVISLIFIIIIMTGSRGGLFANIAVVISFMIINKDNHLKKIGLCLCGIAFLAIVFFAMKDYIAIDVLDRFGISEIANSGGTGRFKIWEMTMSYYKNSSIWRIFFGSGFSTFSHISQITMGIPKVAHNIYIQTLVEGGIIGFIILISMLFISIKNAYKNNNIYIVSAIIGAIVAGASLDIYISRFFWNILFFSTFNEYK